MPSVEEFELEAIEEGFAERASREGEVVVIPQRRERFGPLVRKAREESVAPAEMQELLGDQELVVKPRVQIKPKPMPAKAIERDDRDEYEQLMLHDE